MKEAAGEANMTVIAIVLIGLVLVIGTPVITNIIGRVEQRSCCVENGGNWTNGGCVGASAECGGE